MKIISRKRIPIKKGYTYLGRGLMVDELPENMFNAFLSTIKRNELNTYPDMDKTYSILSEHLGISVDNLLITQGCEGAYRHIFEMLDIKTAGALNPTCALTKVYADLHGVRLLPIMGKSPDYNISVEQVKAIIPHIDVLFLDNPKYHLENCFSNEELYNIINYCEHHNVIIFLDEVYVGFGVEGYPLNIHLHKNLIIARSFSKINALPSIHVGYLITNKKLKKVLESSRYSYETNYFGCKATEFVCKYQEYFDEMAKKVVAKRKEWCRRLFKDFKVYEGYAHSIRIHADKETIDAMENRFLINRLVVNRYENNLIFCVTLNKELERLIFESIGRYGDE